MGLPGSKHRKLVMKKPCPVCNKEFSKPYTESVKAWTNRHKFCSRACYVESMRGKDPFLGKKRNVVYRNKGEKRPQTTGENNSRWSRIKLNCLECEKEFEVRYYRKDVARFCSKDCAHRNRDCGFTPEHERVRKSKDYAIWRDAVFMRDDYTCQECEQRGGTLNADHIKPFALYPELRLAIDNGRTLCVKCHHNTSTHGYRKIYRENCLAVNTEA